MATLNFNQEQCILCGQCVEKCPFGALEILDNKIEINASCKMCKLCVKSCPVQAVSLVEDAVKQTVDKDAWKGVMVFVEQEESGIHPVAFELIGKARELAAKINHPVYAVLIGGGQAKERPREVAPTRTTVGFTVLMQSSMMFVYTSPRKCANASCA